MTTPSTQPEPRRRFSFFAQPLWLFALAFLISRYLFLLIPPPPFHAGLYADYAYKFLEGQRRNVSMYDLHEQAIRRIIKRAHTEHQPLAAQGMETHLVIEYPPLALAMLVVPAIGLDHPKNQQELMQFVDEHHRKYRFGMFLIDIAMFLLLVLCLKRLYPNQANRFYNVRLLCFLVFGVLVFPLLYDSLDIVLAFLLLASYYLLISNRNYAWSFLVLALAINYKLVPIILAPIWIFSALPAQSIPTRLSFTNLWSGKNILPLTGGILVRTGVLIVLIAGIFLPFLMLGGVRTLDYLSYHQERGIEINSTYSSLLMFLQLFGHDINIFWSHGCANVQSSLVPYLTIFSTIGLFFSLTIISCMCCVAFCFRRCAPSHANNDKHITFAQCHPDTLILFTVVILFVALMLSKVFSPQYLHWLLPLIVLLNFQRLPRFVTLSLFGLVCLTTTIVYPVLGQHLSGLVSFEDRTFLGPNLLGAAALATRNVIFIGFVSYLVIHLLREMRYSFKLAMNQNFHAASPEQHQRESRLDPKPTKPHTPAMHHGHFGSSGVQAIADDSEQSR